MIGAGIASPSPLLEFVTRTHLAGILLERDAQNVGIMVR